MDRNSTHLKYRNSVSSLFADEIIIGNAPIVTKNFVNNSDIDLFQNTSNTASNKVKPFSENYLLTFSFLSLTITFSLFLLTKLINLTLSDFSGNIASFFVYGYFLLFVISVFLITKKRTVSLEVKENYLHIKSFPSLNKKIPINNLLRCELNTMRAGNFNYQNRTHFSLHSNNNKYKQPLASGITLQLIDGSHIIIGSKKD